MRAFVGGTEAAGAERAILPGPCTRLCQITAIAAAMNTLEYVPVTMPTIIVKANPCSTSPDAQNLAAVGVIEGIQNVASHRPFGPEVFLGWLGPASRAAWDELCMFWGQVAAAKAAGLLGPSPDQPAPPVVDPADVQDPSLRRVIEQLYRK